MTAKLTEKPRKSPLPHPARRHLALAPSVSRFAAPPATRFVPAKAVGSFVPTLTKKAFEKFGFSTATLITDWANIAGAELAEYTAPERLKWPRGTQADGIHEDEGERRGATLILRVDPARALDVEYRTRQITDRINAYFGYRAVEAIRLVQAPLPSRASPPPPLSGRTEEGRSPADDPLLAALTRLEQGVRRHQSTRRA
ncbi:DciA family protein [Hyphomicrobium sp.]|uniref:DUF721 domain-containing protein n=1 Tax=Hyphomicrobium sp. TaxID=82 RepID=UPI0025BE9207|nr:DciA family protein [Hyphomicrobium sp.]MCC7253234.1 DUF721 domain-containing protein [Hyphomicrobium sp.]